ncbi:HPr family phosphocarrier protein, partial [Burkholderia cenocepacia]|nr:HPr family phosphocarrier protein [Burkholderia cenocepacia]
DATVAAARRFDSDIQLIANGHSSNAKDGDAIAPPSFALLLCPFAISWMSLSKRRAAATVASLQVHGGTSAQVLATGPDEEAALQALL